MQAADIVALPSMPLASPSYPREPHRFIDRESDPDGIRAALPERCSPTAAIACSTNLSACRNSAGFGDYIQSGQVIPALLNGESVNFADLTLPYGRVLHDYNARR